MLGMVWFSWGMVIWLAACGSVAKATDASVDSPDPMAPLCSAPQLSCGGPTCVDSMTDNAHCGSCAVACKTGATCMAGHCTDMVTSCHQIHDINGAAQTGMYTLIDGSQIFFDMTNMLQYDGWPNAMVMAPHDAAPVGYTIIGAAELTNPVTAQTFITLYNMQAGLKVLANFSSPNCCLKGNNTNDNTMLFITVGTPQDVYPANNNALQCNPASGYLPTTTYQLVLAPDTATPIYANSPLANDYFTVQHIPASTTGCTMTGSHPAMYWRKHAW